MSDIEAEKQALQTYLDQHKVETRLNELLNKLVFTTPQKPFEWLAEQLSDTAPSGGPTWPTVEVAAADPGMASLLKRWDVVLGFLGGSGGSPAAASGGASAAATPVPAAAAAAEGGGKDKDAKKAAKAAEKAAKEAEKERKRKEREDAERKKLDGPEVRTLTLLNFMEADFGQLEIQSHGTTGRKWTDVSDLEPSLAGKEVWVRVRLHNSRKQSAKLGFLVLRQRLFTVQAVVQGKDLAAFACGLPKESVIDVLAEVTVPPEAVASCTQSGVELAVKRVYSITKATPRLPLQLDDASRSNEEIERLKLPRVDQNTRLDNRVIDMRTAANQGIFRLQSAVCEHFRGFLLSQGCAETRARRGGHEGHLSGQLGSSRR